MLPTPNVSHSSGHSCRPEQHGRLLVRKDTSNKNEPKLNKGSPRSSVVANLNIALAALNPNHPIISSIPSPSVLTRSPPAASLSFSSAASPSTAMLSSNSARSFDTSDRETSRSHCDEASLTTTSRKTSSNQPKYKPTLNAMLPVTVVSPSSPSSSPFQESGLTSGSSSPHFSPRPSLDSAASSGSSSTRSRIGGKVRKNRIAVPPPLKLDNNNLHRSPSGLPVIEINPPPRIESRTIPVEQPSKTPSTPSSPGFQPPSIEQQQKRRLEKVVRILGEQVPSELIYHKRVKPIINVHTFPDPPTPVDSDTLTRQQQKDHGRMNRRASFTLSSFPNLSSMTTTLLPSHVRSKSRDLDQLPSVGRDASQRQGRTPNDLHALAPNNVPPNLRPRPESGLLSPIIFASRRPISQLISPTTSDVDAGEDQNVIDSPPRSRDRATKTTRRASFPAANHLPSTPTHSSFVHAQYPSSSSDPNTIHNTEPQTPKASSKGHLPLEPYIDASYRQSTTLPPMTFSKPTMMLNPFFAQSLRMTVDDIGEHTETDAEGGDEDEWSSSDSRTPPSSDSRYRQLSKPYSQSADGHDPPSGIPAHMYPRPETPFADSGVLLRPGPSKWLKPRGVAVTVDRRVTRKEKRQGWSGEWNRGDMQDVIQKLRSLK